MNGIAHSRTASAGLSLLPLVVIHRSGDVACTADLALCRQHASGREEERSGRRCAQLEVERAIRTDCDARRNGRSGVVVCCTGVELLCRRQKLRSPSCVGNATLQKSMLFTPLLPSAGPTGGEGDACPAPTMSLTIWSLARAFFAMLQELGVAENCSRWRATKLRRVRRRRAQTSIEQCRRRHLPSMRPTQRRHSILQHAAFLLKNTYLLNHFTQIRCFLHNQYGCSTSSLT